MYMASRERLSSYVTANPTLLICQKLSKKKKRKQIVFLWPEFLQCSCHIIGISRVARSGGSNLDQNEEKKEKKKKKKRGAKGTL